ncbi:Melanoma inhibitory activity protein 2 [Vulpes lagopus]
MEGQLAAPEMPPQLVLEQLWAALLEMYKSMAYVPGISEFLWDILVCTMVVVFLVTSQHSLRRVIGQLGRQCAQVRVTGKGVEGRRPATQAPEALTSPVGVASPPTLEILPLAAPNENPSRSSVEHTTQLLTEGWSSRPANLSQVNERHPTSGASQDPGKPPGRKTDGSKDSPDGQGRPDSLVQGLASHRSRMQAEVEKARPQLLSPEGQQASSEDRGHVLPLGQTMLKMLHLLELIRHHMDGGGAVGSREVETQVGPMHLSAVLPLGTPTNGDCQGSLHGPDAQKEEQSRELMQETQRIGGLTGQITYLQAEEVSMLMENAQLESEIQKLQVKLQRQPEMSEEHIHQLERKWAEEEKQCVEMEKQLPKVHKSLTITRQIRNLYKKMAEDLCRELQRTTFSHEQEDLLWQRRAWESQRAALSAERELHELRRQSHQLRQRLAHISRARVQPVPWGPRAPAAPPAAPRRPRGPQGPLCPQVPQQRAGERLQV